MPLHPTTSSPNTPFVAPSTRRNAIRPRSITSTSKSGAQTGIRAPDALQLAAAREANCAAFITNHRRLPRLVELPIRQLADYLPSDVKPP